MDRFLVTFEYQGMRNTIVILAHDESEARKAMDYYDIINVEEWEYETHGEIINMR